MSNIFLFCSFLIESQCASFSELSLAKTIQVVAPVSYNYLTQFNSDGRVTKDVHLTCRWHLTNVMPGHIFHESNDDTENYTP